MMELALKNVSKQFKQKIAVNDVSIVLDNGVHALLGANGSGKTTLIRMICGILPVSKGMICFDGISIKQQYQVFCDHLGYMPQHFGFYPNYSVIEFLEYIAIVKRIPKTIAEQRIDHWIHKLNMQEHAHQKMKHLSGGMLKRVGIIQALLNEPDILILDEPTAGLDPKERIVFRNLIASLSKQCLILISTHIVSDIESIADDILVMKGGKIILHDTCEQLLETMKHKVWKVRVKDIEANQLLLQHIIVNTHQIEDSIDLRIVSDTKPWVTAIETQPDLDDLYLYHFNEEGD